MNYHVIRGGEKVGELSLEELRRRRAEGGLTGGEQVWREGMTAWQPIDAVLQAAESGVPTPPPLPGAKRRRKSNGLLIGAIIGAALVFAVGVGYVVTRVVRVVSSAGTKVFPREFDNGLELASRPILQGSNVITPEQLRQRAEEFRMRQWVEGYRERGHRDQPCDADALNFLTSWIDQNYGAKPGTNHPPLEKWSGQLAAAPGCDDPLVLAATGSSSIELHEANRRFERALGGFASSRHRAYPKFYAAVMLARAFDDDPGRLAELDKQALTHFEECFQDGSFLPKDEQELAEIFVGGWGYNFFYRNHAAVPAVVARHGGEFKWLSLFLEGEHQIREAWAARGGGYANTVTPEGWRGFSKHLAQARTSLSRAWKLHPDRPAAPARMISVSLGGSGLEEMRLWFDRTTAAQFDHKGAWSDLRWGLRPRWHGSLEAMQALGVAALNTARFDTDVPRKFFDVVSDLESELAVPPGQHIYGRDDIWPELQRMYEGYLAHPAQAATRNGWRNSFAMVAYLAGHYDVARTQLEALHWKYENQSRTAWGGEFSLMPLEVAARTGELAQEITRAENAVKRGKITDAIQIYADLAPRTEVDERTHQFIRSRLPTLELEQLLAAGKWVSFLPAAKDDPVWAWLLGQSKLMADGALEVESGPDGHFVFSRMRVGADFEVNGEFEVARSSTASFQAGLIFGTPDLNSYDWLAFRIKKNETEGEVATVARNWSKPQLSTPLALDPKRNSFQFRFTGGKATASVNNMSVFENVASPMKIHTPAGEVRLGFGAFNDSNDTVIRYRNVQVHRLPPRKVAAEE